MRAIILLIAFVYMTLSPVPSFACSCGCGIFDIQTDTLLPTREGGTVWLDYSFANQETNWHKSASSATENNEDKVVRTHFITLGGQYVFNPSWGVSITVPYIDRYFSTTDEDSGHIVGFNHDNFGDVRLRAKYTGFSPDMATGVTLGVKLPTGDYHYSGFDRDTALGTGSTDLLIGAYHIGTMLPKWNWFTNSELQYPVITTADYRPGTELNVTAGTYYTGWNIHSFHISPIAQLIATYRLHDSGVAAEPDNTGYKRVSFSPAIEISKNSWRVYSSIAFPVYQYVNGNQLVASDLFKISISHDF